MCGGEQEQAALDKLDTAAADSTPCFYCVLFRSFNVAHILCMLAL
jgi:hypothetical protein